MIILPSNAPVLYSLSISDLAIIRPNELGRHHIQIFRRQLPNSPTSHNTKSLRREQRCRIKTLTPFIQLLHLNQHWEQDNALYVHHQSTVIGILLDIGDYNILIAIEISFNIEMHFGVQNRLIF